MPLAAPPPGQVRRQPDVHPLLVGPPAGPPVAPRRARRGRGRRSRTQGTTAARHTGQGIVHPRRRRRTPRCAAPAARGGSRPSTVKTSGSTIRLPAATGSAKTSRPRFAARVADSSVLTQRPPGRYARCSCAVPGLLVAGDVAHPHGGLAPPPLAGAAPPPSVFAGGAGRAAGHPVDGELERRLAQRHAHRPGDPGAHPRAAGRLLLRVDRRDPPGRRPARACRPRRPAPRRRRPPTARPAGTPTPHRARGWPDADRSSRGPPSGSAAGGQRGSRHPTRRADAATPTPGRR